MNIQARYPVRALVLSWDFQFIYLMLFLQQQAAHHSKLHQGSSQRETDQQDFNQHGRYSKCQRKIQIFIYPVGSKRDCAHWPNLEKMGEVRKSSAQVGKYIGILIFDPLLATSPLKSLCLPISTTSALKYYKYIQN